MFGDEIEIPTIEDFSYELMQKLETVRFPGGEGLYDGLHPWAIKAILDMVSKQVVPLLDYAFRYKQLSEGQERAYERQHNTEE